MSSFKPIVITTTNVQESLKGICKQYQFDMDQINFDIIGFNTFYNKLPSTQWIPITPDKRRQIIHIKNLTNSEISLKEQYKLKVYLKEFPKGCHPLIKLTANSSYTEISAIIKKESQFALTKLCLQEYIHEIKRKLIYNGFLIGLFLIDLEKALAPLIGSVQKQKCIEEDLKIIVSKAVPPSTNIAAKIIRHYLNKHEDQRTAYESGVDEDEIILEYQLPHRALGGRSCRGLYLAPLGPKIESNMLIYTDPKTIYRTQESNKLFFLSRKQGYVHYEDQHLSISNELKLESARFNTTGSITPGGHRNVNLKIASDDEFDDAINTGVNIDVSNIDVHGSIGGNTNLKAESIKVDAQTHKNATIEVAEEASVYLHRGNLKAKEADIIKMEHGTIEAETVKVKELLGGEIKAKRVYVDLLHSNAKIIFSEYCEINRISGKHNHIFVAPAQIESQDEKIEAIEQQISKQKIHINELQHNYDFRISQFEKSYERIDTFKLQVVQAIKAQKNPPKAAMVRVKQYGIDQKQLDSLANTIKEAKLELEALISELDKYKNIMQYATLVYKGVWDGQQEIFFEDPNSLKLEKYIPEGLIKEVKYNNLSEADLIQLSRED